ncbi:MAG: hypothetical protein GKR97_15790 [Rhizobiaceae bacterium]|nr:hypothetical protein [Rhizobiaceae bacterium]
MDNAVTPEQTNLHGTPMRRMITGLWPMAGRERDSRTPDLDAAAAALIEYVQFAELHAAAPGPSKEFYTLEPDANGVHGRIIKYDLNAEVSP